MMELDEAIKHCKEKAEELHDREIYTDTDGIECMDYECNQCAKEHEQLAEWLTDYKRLKALEEQERPTGKWVYDDTYYDEDNPIGGDIYHCSICKRSITTTLTKPTDLFPFCHCGAKMKQEVKDEAGN